MTIVPLTEKDGYWSENETEFYVESEFDGCNFGSELLEIFQKMSIFCFVFMAVSVLACISCCCKQCK